MRAHIIEAGKIANTIEVESLDVLPNLIDADIHGGDVGDSWDGQTVSKELLDVVLARLAKNADINNWRSVANTSSFTHQGKQIACDALSRSDIDGVAGSIALTGAFPADFPGAWKAIDNSYVLLPTVDDFKALYAAMTAQGTANFLHAQALKTATAAATTQAELNAIVW